jgi:hypothetical protein
LPEIAVAVELFPSWHEQISQPVPLLFISAAGRKIL